MNNTSLKTQFTHLSGLGKGMSCSSWETLRDSGRQAKDLLKALGDSGRQAKDLLKAPENSGRQAGDLLKALKDSGRQARVMWQPVRYFSTSENSILAKGRKP